MTDHEELYRTYFMDVYRYILGLSGNERTAQEITSDTFFRAMRSINSFRGDCDVRVWLCQIAKNCYLSYLKKRGREESIDGEELYEIPDDAPNAEQVCLGRDEAAKIRRILHEIADPYKEVFLWRVYGELSFAEIAEIFGKTENWACVTYHRAKKLIKERMEEKKSEK